MKTRWSLSLLLAALVACDAGAPQQPVAGAENAVIGGSLDVDDRTPAIWIQFRGEDGRPNGCTAVPVAPTALLTAAHCVSTGNGAILPAFGPGEELQYTHEGEIDQSMTFRRAKILQTFVHPLYAAAKPIGWTLPTQAPYAPDLGVIILQDPLPFDIPIAIIDAQPVQSGEQVTIVGYGCSHDNDEEDTIQQRRSGTTTTLPPAAMTNDEVLDTLRPADPDALAQNYIITRGPRFDPAYAGICHGDSGGPLFRGGVGSVSLIGIHSMWVPAPGDASQVGTRSLHTRIINQQILSWIQLLLFSSDTTAPPPQPNGVTYLGSGWFAWDMAPTSVLKQTLIVPGGTPVDVPIGTNFARDTVNTYHVGDTGTAQLCFQNFSSVASCVPIVFEEEPPKGGPALLPGPRPENVKLTFPTPGTARLTWSALHGGGTWHLEARQWQPVVEPAWREGSPKPDDARDGIISYDVGKNYDFRVCYVTHIFHDITSCSKSQHFDVPDVFATTEPRAADGSFEFQDATASWSGGGVTVHDASLARSGDTVLSLLAGDGMAGAAQVVPVEAGAEQTLTLWLFGNVDTIIGVARPDGTPIASRVVRPTLAGWTRHDLRFAAPDENVKIFARAFTPQLAPDAVLYLDDVVVRDAFECIPRTCDDAAACGALDDGCGVTLDCGGCAAGSTCGGDGFANVCSAEAAPAFPATGSEQCDGIGGGSLQAITAQLAETLSLAAQAGADAAVVDALAHARGRLVELDTWLAENALDASNPSAASNVLVIGTEVHAELLSAAGALARLAGADAQAALARLDAILRATTTLGTQAGRCFFDKYARVLDSWWDWRLGRQPETAAAPAPALPTTCAALDQAALAPLIGWLEASIAAEEATLVAFGGEWQAHYAEEDIGSASEQLAALAELRAALGDTGSAADAALAARLADDLATIGNRTLFAAIRASLIGTDLPGPSRWAFETDIAAAQHALGLAARARRCLATGATP
jgi:hypothetical protein